jgi:hypothetical protein
MEYLDKKFWNGRRVYHGCGISDSCSIQDSGIVLEKCSGGYFGYGFYVTEKRDLAVSNYAEWSDEGPDGAAVISYTISQRANILDLRRPEDWETWKALEAKHTGRWISDKGLATWLVSQGVDGVYDNSMDGICIYNFDVLEDADFQSLKIAQKISNPAP